MCKKENDRLSIFLFMDMIADRIQFSPFCSVINVSGAFKPAAAHQVQRGSPDLHGCWMLPQEIKVAPKAKSQRTLDQEESEDDSEEEEEKAVIRIGSSFQAIIPEKIDPGSSSFSFCCFHLFS